VGQGDVIRLGLPRASRPRISGTALRPRVSFLQIPEFGSYEREYMHMNYDLVAQLWTEASLGLSRALERSKMRGNSPSKSGNQKCQGPCDICKWERKIQRSVTPKTLAAHSQGPTEPNRCLDLPAECPICAMFCMLERQVACRNSSSSSYHRIELAFS
jgi:hypothetical protein